MTTHWIVVADASRARLFGSDLLLEEFDWLETLDNPSVRARDKDVLSDGPGKVHTGGGSNATAYSHHGDRKEHDADTFAREIAQVLHDSRVATHFERLILVAPPHFLGQLRRHLDPPTRRAVVAEIGKDYNHVRQLELPDMVRAKLPPFAGMETSAAGAA